MTAKRWRSRVRGVLTDRGRVLVLAVTADCPRRARRVRGRRARGGPRRLRAARRRRVAILRYLVRSVDRERKRLDVVYALELLDRLGPPARRLRDGATVARRQRCAVGAAQGWLAEATAWIESSLARPRPAPTGPRRAGAHLAALGGAARPDGGWSRVLQGDLASPLFVDEGRVMDGLARLFPARGAEAARDRQPARWMLLDDIGAAIGWDAPLEERESVLRVFAFMQVASSSRSRRAARDGLHRPPAGVARAGDERSSSATTRRSPRSTRTRARGCARSSRSRRALRPARGRAGAGRARPRRPAPGQRRARRGSYVFFDWSDACVTHPFLDLIDFTARRIRPSATACATRISRSGPTSPRRERLLDALGRSSTPLASLNQAVSYRHIAASVEPGSVQQLEWALPHWLRLVLETDFDSLPLSPRYRSGRTLDTRDQEGTDGSHAAAGPRAQRAVAEVAPSIRRVG